MTAESKCVLGLDLGTTKICAVIAEIKRDHPLRILGFASCPSQGLRRGVIIDVQKTVEAIKKSVKQASLMAGVEVNEAYVGIAGDHVNSMNSSGVVAVSDEDGRISESDVERVVQSAAAVKVPIDREILHTIPQEFVIDGRREIVDPVGMLGVRLEAHVHVVTGAVSAVQNMCMSIERAGLHVKDIALEPLASSSAVLESEEREMGVCLVDIGGGTTDIAVFSRGGISYSGVIGLGGHNVTNDIAIGLRASWAAAEDLKCKASTVDLSQIQSEEQVGIPNFTDRPDQNISRILLSEIVEARMEEIFLLVREKLGEKRLDLASGIVLTGGGALLNGVVKHGEQILGLPVRLGVPKGVHGMVEGIERPSHATAIGLAFLAREQLGNSNDSYFSEADLEGAGFEAVFGRMKAWFQTWI
ncbi:MAG: cell division protein FtsA [Candidatus Latescibacterota bacterium]|nr:cell division protein FtsA [Candidatus Latescibacterota bacterium]